MQVGSAERCPGGGRSWSGLPWQGTAGEQRPRAPRHDPSDVALSDVPQAKRAGAAVPKADYRFGRSAGGIPRLAG
jgi:hypothetical protein